MRAAHRLMVLIVAAVLALSACSSGTDGSSGGDSGSYGGASGSGDSGSRLAFGLHELEDGTVVALGVLERVDLEGGFYALTGAPDGGGTIAVIANPDDFAAELEALVGGTVQVHGTLAEGPSIRMAGPEIVTDSIEEITDTPGPAE